MSGARRDFTFFVVGGAGARFLDSANHADAAGMFAALVSGAVVVALVWIATGWRLSRRERPL